jgi:hypothetical protein
LGKSIARKRYRGTNFKRPAGGIERRGGFKIETS